MRLWTPMLGALCACACSGASTGTAISADDSELRSTDGHMLVSFLLDSNASTAFEATLERLTPSVAAAGDLQYRLRASADLRGMLVDVRVEPPPELVWGGFLGLEENGRVQADTGAFSEPGEPPALSSRVTVSCGEDTPSGPCTETILAVRARTLERFCASSVMGDPCLLCAANQPFCRNPSDLHCDEDSVCRPVQGDDDPLAALVTPGTRGLSSFVVDSLYVAPAGSGLPRDPGDCPGSTYCPVNRAWPLGVLNDALRQGLLGGELLLLAEVRPKPGPGGFEARMLSASDADRPFFPANNFHLPYGDDELYCCQFVVNDPRGQPGTPFEPAVERDGWLHFPLGDHTLRPTLLDEDDVWRTVLGLVQSRAAVRIDRHLSRIERGLISGVLPARVLAEPLNSNGGSALGVLARERQPDVDLDVPPNGLNTFEVDEQFRVVACYGPDQSSIPPVDPNDPASCARSPLVTDGYSVALEFTAQRAVRTSTTVRYPD